MPRGLLPSERPAAYRSLVPGCATMLVAFFLAAFLGGLVRDTVFSFIVWIPVLGFLYGFYLLLRAGWKIRAVCDNCQANWNFLAIMRDFRRFHRLGYPVGSCQACQGEVCIECGHEHLRETDVALVQNVDGAPVTSVETWRFTAGLYHNACCHHESADLGRFRL
jgi:hypothetical protein